MSGTVKIARAIFEHPAFKAEPLTEREAFMWLVMEARWKPDTRRIGQAVVHLDRGQLAASVRFLAEAWQWSKSRVDRFLTRVSDMGMVCVENGTGVNVITVCNYDEYQGARDSSGTAAGQQRDSSGTKEKKGEIREEGKVSSDPDGSLPDPVAINEISEAVEVYAAAAERQGWAKVQKLTPTRRAALRGRLKDAGGIQGWRDALRRAEASDFLCGRAVSARGSPFRCTFDFLTQQSSFIKLIEGNYDNRPAPDRASTGSPHPGGNRQPDGVFGAVLRRQSARTH